LGAWKTVPQSEVAATSESDVFKMNKACSAGIPEDTTRKIIADLQAH
jgi:hypothetical protein